MLLGKQHWLSMLSSVQWLTTISHLLHTHTHVTESCAPPITPVCSRSNFSAHSFPIYDITSPLSSVTPGIINTSRKVVHTSLMSEVNLEVPAEGSTISRTSNWEEESQEQIEMRLAISINMTLHSWKDSWEFTKCSYIPFTAVWVHVHFHAYHELHSDM